MAAGRSACAWIGAAVFAAVNLPPNHAAASGLRLSISAGMSTGTPVHREWHGSVVLTVPFDALVAANDRAPNSPVFESQGLADPPEEPPEARPDADETPPPRQEPVDVRAEEPEQSSSTRQASSEPLLDPDLARQTVAVAKRIAGLGAGKRRLFAMAGRARTAALLPELRISGGRSSDASLRLSPTTTDPYRYTETGGQDLFVEATLTWRLDRLVFADAELAVERILDGRDAAEMRLIALVLRELFAFRHAQLRQADSTLDPEQRVLAALDQIEAEATLDVLTDGWFSRKVSKRASNP